ncbi:MAG: hypothetical protein ABI835_02820 [Chloroflexota bacterium]
MNATQEETIVTESAVIQSIVSDFDLDAIKFLGRADVVNVKGTTDTYMKVSVATKDGGIMVTTPVFDVVNNRKVTLTGDLVMFRLTRIAYGESSEQGASVLANFKRYSEAKTEFFAIASRDSAGKVTVQRLCYFNRSDKSYVDCAGLIEGYKVTQQDMDVFASMINTFMHRVNANKPARDQRYTEIEGKRVGVGQFGKYDAQRKANRA